MRNPHLKVVPYVQVDICLSDPSEVRTYLYGGTRKLEAGDLIIVPVKDFFGSRSNYYAIKKVHAVRDEPVEDVEQDWEWVAYLDLTPYLQACTDREELRLDMVHILAEKEKNDMMVAANLSFTALPDPSDHQGIAR